MAFVYDGLVLGSEEQRDAPDTCKSDYGIDYSADDASLSSADPRDYIKLEKTDATPVKRADYGEDERYFVHNHMNFLHSAAPAANYNFLFQKRNFSAIIVCPPKKLICKIKIIGRYIFLFLLHKRTRCDIINRNFDFLILQNGEIF